MYLQTDGNPKQTTDNYVHCVGNRFATQIMSRRTMFDTKEHFANKVADCVEKIGGRRAVFHGLEVVLHLGRLPVGLKALIKDGSKSAAPRVGSAAGLRTMEKQRGLKKRLCIDDVAAECGMSANQTQTCLCIYKKYLRSF